MRALYTFIYSKPLQTLVVRNYFSEVVASHSLKEEAMKGQATFFEEDSGLTWSLALNADGSERVSLINLDGKVLLSQVLSADLDLVIHEVLRNELSSIQINAAGVRMEVQDFSGQLLHRSHQLYQQRPYLVA